MIQRHWNFLSFEDSHLDDALLMDHTDLEVAGLEILWRVLPPYTVMVPVQLPPHALA